MTKSVAFGTIKILEFPLVLGDNPSCHHGPPIELSWNVTRSLQLDLNIYENNRQRRREGRELKLSPFQRYQRLRDTIATGVVVRGGAANVRVDGDNHRQQQQQQQQQQNRRRQQQQQRRRRPPRQEAYPLKRQRSETSMRMKKNKPMAMMMANTTVRTVPRAPHPSKSLSSPAYLSYSSPSLLQRHPFSKKPTTFVDENHPVMPSNYCMRRRTTLLESGTVIRTTMIMIQ